jgi:hypothetical protein
MTQPTAPEPAPAPDAAKLLEALMLEQNWRAAMLAGTTTAVLCAAAWAALTYATNTQFGIVAIAVGAVIGVSVRHFGKGVETKFGVLGAVLAIAAILLGNILTVIGFASKELNQSFFSTLVAFDWAAAPRVLAAFMGPMDFLFYGIAIYEGYRFSFRSIAVVPAAPGSEGAAG